MPLEHSEIGEFTALRQRLTALANEHRRLSVAHQSTMQALNQSEQHRSSQRIEIETLRKSLTDFMDEHRKLLETHQETIATLNEARQSHAGQVADIEALHRKFSDLNEQLQERERALASSLKTSEADRAAQFEQVKILDKALKESEADRAARFEQIKILAKWVEQLSELEGSRFWRACRRLYQFIERHDRLRRMARRIAAPFSRVRGPHA